MLKSQQIIFISELPEHVPQCEALALEAFGPGMYARAAFRLREMVPHEQDLSFVCLMDKKIVGYVWLSVILIGKKSALLLGPLVVAASFKNLGIGKRLVQIALDKTRNRGDKLVMLIGDEPYYRSFGFAIAPENQFSMPAPVDPTRILVCELVYGALGSYRGIVEGAVKVNK